jgi:hypothetical protein
MSDTVEAEDGPPTYTGRRGAVSRRLVMRRPGGKSVVEPPSWSAPG